MRVDETVITCCHETCGISFAVPDWWAKGRRETHARFFCPNGHGQSFTSETDAEKYRRERDRLKQDAARLEDSLALERKRAEKAEREAKRTKKRAEAALCPCCNRHFSQLERHMKHKHPEIATLHPKKAKA